MVLTGRVPRCRSQEKLRQQSWKGGGSSDPSVQRGNSSLSGAGRGGRQIPRLPGICARLLQLERWARALSTCRCLHPLIPLGRGGGGALSLGRLHAPHARASACKCDPKTWRLPRRRWGPWSLPAPARAARGFLLWGARHVAMENSEGPGRSRSRRGREGGPGDVRALPPEDGPASHSSARNASLPPPRSFPRNFHGDLSTRGVVGAEFPARTA